MAHRAPVQLSLAEAGDLIRRRALSPVELLDAVLARIATLNPELNAFTTLAPPAELRAAARQAEQEITRGEYRGPFHGIPVGVKDLLDTAGLRTTYGSGMFRDHVPAVDAAIPARLRTAGAIIVGKTATHEFGKGITTNNYFFGPTRNPWNLDHIPGGSSGGAAAAAAALCGPLQIATDGGGSIRIPAAFCGVVGLKPTLGLLSNRGHTGGGNSSFSVPGPITRSVRDTAIAAEALAGFDAGYIYSRNGPVPNLVAGLEAGVRDLRIGTSPDLVWPAPDPAIATAYEATLSRLENLGARLVEIRLPHHAIVLRAIMGVFSLEGDTLIEALLGDRPRLFSPQLTRMAEQKPVADPALWVHLQQDRQRVRQDYAVAFETADVLVQPVAPLVAPRIDVDEASYIGRCVPYTAAANLVGFPSVALPAGMADGLPMGIQIIAPPGADGLALRVARALEQAASEHRVQTPPLGD